MLFEDIRYALSRFHRRPAFGMVVIICLACGIGANAAIFSAINALLLKSLPVQAPHQLIQLDSVNTQHVNTLRGFSYPGFEMLRNAGSPLLSGMFAYSTADASSSVFSALTGSTVTYAGSAALAKGMLASANMYLVLGVQAEVGRLLVPSDDSVEGASPIAVLSHAYWQSRFGADASIVGKSISVNRTSLTVVGVTPPGFRGVELGYAPDFTVPIGMATALKWQTRENASEWWLAIMARKRPGVSDGQVEAALQPVFRATVNNLIQATPASLANDIQPMVAALVLKVNPASQGVTSEARDELRRNFAYLMGMVVVLLAIACVNVANLVLAQSAARSSEIRVRLALGASGARVFRQMLTELLLLAAIAGVLALPCAFLGGPVLLKTFADEAINSSLNYTADWRVFGFVLLAALGCGTLLGFVPMLPIAKTKLQGAVNAGRTHPVGVPGLLIMSQISLALLLAVGAGLLVRSFQNIRRIDPGFRPDKVLVFHVTPSGAGYDALRERELYSRLMERLQRLPEVHSVSYAKFAPGDSSIGTFVRIPGQPLSRRPEPVSINVVAPDYFNTVGIDFVAGRTFDMRPQPAAVVNQAFARKYFGSRNPVGNTFTMLGDDKAFIQIVGVVKDVKEHGLLAPVPSMAYLPYTEGSGDLTFFVRTRRDPLDLVTAVRRELKQIDPLVPLSNISTLDLQLTGSVSRERVLAVLASVMGGLALALASIGLYGVIAYSVSRETKSIGIRMALGARPAGILRDVFQRVLVLVAGGAGAGLIAVLILSRYMASLLYDLAPNDPAIIGMAAAVLITSSLAAAYFPARRAARIDPAIALRHE